MPLLDDQVFKHSIHLVAPHRRSLSFASLLQLFMMQKMRIHFRECRYDDTPQTERNRGLGGMCMYVNENVSHPKFFTLCLYYFYKYLQVHTSATQLASIFISSQPAGHEWQCDVPIATLLFS